MAQDLTYEERVASRLTRDLLGQRTPGVVHLVSRRRLDQRSHILEAKPGEPHPLHPLLAMKIGH